jgi:L-rhamnose mutarotase
MTRYGSTIRVRPEKIEEYKRLHAAVWPDVLSMINACNIRNYSIYLIGTTLFAYFEYTGKDFAADMKKMADDPTTQRWWEITKPCQEPVPDARPGEWWATMDEVFHTP